MEEEEEEEKEKEVLEEKKEGEEGEEEEKVVLLHASFKVETCLEFKTLVQTGEVHWRSQDRLRILDAMKLDKVT